MIDKVAAEDAEGGTPAVRPPRRRRRGLFRRLLRALVVAGGLLVAVAIVAVLSTQTGWFKDWLRRYIIRQADQVLDARLSIGAVRGNLFFGVELDDVVVSRGGARVVSLDRVRASYSVFDFISRRWHISELELGRPLVTATRTSDGWDVTRLLKPRTGGPAGSPTIGIGTLRMYDARVVLSRPAPELTTRLDDMDLVMGVSLDRGGFGLDLRHLSLQIGQPALRVGRVAGRVERRGSVVTLSGLRVDLPVSHVRVDGTVTSGGARAVLDLAVASDTLAFREVGLFVPAVARIPLQPSFRARLTGPVDRLITDLDLQSRAGGAQGRVTIVPGGERPSVEGTLALVRVDPAPWSQTPAVAGSVTGQTTFAVVFPRGAVQAGRPVPLPVSGRFTFAGPEAGAAGYEAQQVSVRGAFSGASVTIDRASARAYGAAVTTSGRIEPVPGPAPGVQYALTGEVRDMDLRRLPASVPIPDLASSIAAAYTVRGSGRQFSGEVTFDTSTVEGARFDAGTTGHFAREGGTLRYGGTGRLADLSLPRFGRALDLEALTDPRLEGSLAGAFTLTASGRGARELALTATLGLQASTVVGATLPAMAIEARVADGRLEAGLKGSFEQLDLDTAFGRPSLASRLSGRIDGQFTIRDVTEGLAIEGLGFSGGVTLTASTLGEYTITAADMKGGFEGRTVQLQALTATGPLGSLRAEGTLALGETGTSDLRYEIEQLPLGQLRAIVGPVTGTLVTTGRMTGNGAALVATGKARVADLVVGPPAAGATGDPAVTATDSEAAYIVTLPDLDPERAHVQADVSAALASVAGQAIDRASGRVTYAERALAFDIGVAAESREGQAAGRVAFAEGVQRIELDRLALTANGLTWVLAPESAPRITITGDSVELHEVRLANADQRVEVSGTLATGPEGRSGLDISVRGFPLDQVERLLGRPGPPLRGSLNAFARVSGSPAQPEVVGSFAVEKGAFRELTFERIAGALHYNANRVGVDVVVEQQPGAVLSVNGSVPWTLFSGEAKTEAGGEPIDLWVQSSTIGLAVVTGLTAAVTAVEGTARINLHVTGPAENPLFDGGLGVEGGAFTVPFLGRRFSGLTSTFRFEPGRMHVDVLRVLDDDGDPLEVTGEVGLRRLALGEMALTARGREFGIVRNALGTVDLDFDLEATGPVTRPRISGLTSVHSGRVEVDQVLGWLSGERDPSTALDDGTPTMGVGQRPPAPAPVVSPIEPAGSKDAATADGEAESAPTGTWLSGAALDVRVNIPDNLILRGRDLRTSSTSLGLGNVNVTVGGDFRIRKEPATALALVGSVNTVRGTYDFRGRRFEILRDGRIQFQGGQPIDPALDVTAQRVIEPSGVEARIRVQGTARQPTLSFSSTPPLDESDILALIVFNRDLNSLGGDERSSVAALAGATAAGFVVAPLTSSLGRALNLDEFEVQATSEGGTTGGIVTVGEQVGERLFVRFRQQFGAQEVSEFLLEYRLATFLRLQGAVAEGDGVGRANRSLTRRIERAGVDLVFYYSY